VPVTCRLDTSEEVSIYEAGGVLQRFAQDFLESSGGLIMAHIFHKSKSRHLHAWRHQQGRVLPPAGFAAGGAAAGRRARRLLLRVIGSPDPYGKQIDGMGGATPAPARP
jgi:hypothetical protein